MTTNIWLLYTQVSQELSHGSRADSCITGGLRMQMRQKRNHSQFALGQKKRKREFWNSPCRGWRYADCTNHSILRHSIVCLSGCSTQHDGCVAVGCIAVVACWILWHYCTHKVDIQHYNLLLIGGHLGRDKTIEKITNYICEMPESYNSKMVQCDMG